MLNLHVNSTPRHLQITQGMMEDFLIDPVLGARVLLSRNLDVFQKVRLRLCWWVPNVLDSSGFGTGKDFVDMWVFMNLRCLLIPNQNCVALYQTFGAAQEIFWPNFADQLQIGNPIYRANIGRPDFEEGKKEKKAGSEAPACWTWSFKNGSKIRMPAPGWLGDAIGQAGKTYNVAGISEFTKIEKLGRKTTRGEVETHTGIDDQILGRLRGPTFNQFHPLWGNHLVLEATAESPSHPSWQRYQTFLQEVRRGNPDYALFTSCFKDFSNLPSYREGDKDLRPFKEAVPNWATIDRMKKQLTPSHQLRELYGVWARDTRGWYSEESLARCTAYGQQIGTDVEVSRRSGLAS